MWKLGNLQIDGKIVLAPMAGFTSSGYRKFMKPFGVSLCYTEMVSDMGLIYGNKETFSYLEADESEYPLGVQLFGSNPENIAKAASICQKTMKNISFFDINAACPVPKVTKSGAGSSLMKNPSILVEMVKTLKKTTSLPITVKLRLGWDKNSINYFEIIQMLEEAGVDAIALHGRTTKELYSGQPHYELLKDLRTKMKVPLIISGNIFTLDDAINALEITKADAVMIARGGIGNPYLITQIKHYLETKERLESPSFVEQKNYCLELAKYLIEEKGEDKAMRVYRSIAPKFFSGFPNSKELRVLLSTSLDSYQSLEKCLNDYQSSLEE